ncbi:MarR family winged helix-turn-helix transcriptional regulator [Vibrio sp. TRT 21S02]|uniref:MarR family winged helix-turn-helix transcriptional regulator n=1 Tax=Vibrio sp. TRT 21S02 TaxID=3418507 RepID=UPI003CF5504B
MDAIEKVTNQWALEKPELETEPMAIMGRMMRLAKHLEGEVSELHRQYDLKMGEFDVLATLRRSGEPYALTPSELLSSLMLTSGAMTNRLDKLEAKGLIARQHSQEDRRSVTVALTEKGFTLVDSLICEHVAKQQELVRSLNGVQRTELNKLLKYWLAQFEG